MDEQQDEAYGSTELPPKSQTCTLEDISKSVQELSVSQLSPSLKRKAMSVVNPRLKLLKTEAEFATKDLIQNEATLVPAMRKKAPLKRKQPLLLVPETSGDSSEESFKSRTFCLCTSEKFQNAKHPVVLALTDGSLNVSSRINDLKVEIDLIDLGEVHAVEGKMILKTAKTHYVFEGSKLDDWPREIREMKERHFARIFAMPEYSFDQVFQMDRRPLKMGGYSFIQRFKIVSYAGAGGSAVVVYCVKKEDETRRLFVAKCIKHGMNTTKAEMNVFNKLIKRPHSSLCKLDSVFSDTRATHLLLVLGTGRVYSELNPPEPRQDLFAITDSYEPGMFPIERICEGMTQLVDGLLWLLNLGFCHGDIKDENVVVSEIETGRFPISSFDISNKWQWTWIDFGSAKKADALVPCSSFLGTFHYMAPEIADGNYKSNESMNLDEMYDPKKQDVWALGLVLYGMLFGGDAFSSHSDVLLYDWDHLVTFDIFNGRRVVRRSTEGEILDERYYDRLSKMLNKNPGDRADLKDLTSWF